MCLCIANSGVFVFNFSPLLSYGLRVVAYAAPLEALFFYIFHFPKGGDIQKKIKLCSSPLMGHLFYPVSASQNGRGVYCSAIKYTFTVLHIVYLLFRFSYGTVKYKIYLFL